MVVSSAVLGQAQYPLNPTTTMFLSLAPCDILLSKYQMPLERKKETNGIWPGVSLSLKGAPGMLPSVGMDSEGDYFEAD